MLIAKNEVLIKSQFIQIVKGRNKAIIWHSLFGNPKIVSFETLDFLDLFSKPHQLCSVLERYYFKENTEECIQDLIESYYLVKKDFDERDFLGKQGYPIEGIAVTVNDQNFPFIDEKIIDWAKERGMKEVRIDIDIIGMIQTSVENIIEKLMQLRKYARDCNIEIVGFWSRPAENLNDSTLDSHVAFCGMVRGNSICINPSGEIYGCGYSARQLGSLHQIDSFYIAESRYSSLVRDRLTGSMETCKGCIIEGQCGGGCEITQEFSRVANIAKIEIMCDFYRQMTCELLTEQLQELDAEILLG